MTTTRPASTPPQMLINSGVLGRLLNGLHAVRITKITSVWVASDSMNQPARNNSGPAWKTHNDTAVDGRQALLEQDDVGRRFGHVHRIRDRDTDVGDVQ